MRRRRERNLQRSYRIGSEDWLGFPAWLCSLLLLLLYIVLDSLYDLDCFFCAAAAMTRSVRMLLNWFWLTLALSLSLIVLVCLCVRCCSTTSQLIPYCGLLNVAPGVKSSTGNLKRSITPHSAS